jgi:hypothetical protein
MDSLSKKVRTWNIDRLINIPCPISRSILTRLRFGDHADERHARVRHQVVDQDTAAERRPIHFSEMFQ